MSPYMRSVLDDAGGPQLGGRDRRLIDRTVEYGDADVPRTFGDRPEPI
jgi:hypothetical protein